MSRRYLRLNRMPRSTLHKYGMLLPPAQLEQLLAKNARIRTERQRVKLAQRSRESVAILSEKYREENSK